MDEKEFLNRFDNGEKFTEEELSDFRWEFVEVNVKYGDNHRWNRPVTTVFRVDDRLFALEWWEGLTEMQEHEFYKQPYEVEETEKTIIVKEYVKKGEKK